MNGDETMAPLLQVHNLVKQFPIKAGLFRRTIGQVHAVNDVSFDVMPHETVGVVGESGCGKTTLGRSLLRLIEPTSGQVVFDGTDITSISRRQLKPLRRNMQMVFQDPYSSLNPRMPVREIVGEPLRIHGVSRSETRERVGEMLSAVGLLPEHGSSYPHEFSGGQRQRIGIARALILRPRMLVLDEPVSALDVSIQAQVLNMLEELQEHFRLSMLFIAHDLSVVRHISDRVVVMYLGRVVEIASCEDLYGGAAHPYTHSLLSAVPIPDPRAERARERIVLQGDVPSPASPPPGCHFHPRCPIASEICREEAPQLQPVGDGRHMVSCHFPLAVGEQLLDRVRQGAHAAG